MHCNRLPLPAFMQNADPAAALRPCVDDYAREKKAFQAKFGARDPLVKRLAQPAKS